MADAKTEKPKAKATFTGAYLPTETEGERIPANFIPGIPARDLDAEDWARLTPEQQLEVWDSGLYDVTGTRPKTPEPETPAAPQAPEPAPTVAATP